MIPVSTNILYLIRKLFIKNSQQKLSPSHLSEAIANGYGYKTHASILADIKQNSVTVEFNHELFKKRLSEWYSYIDLSIMQSIMEALDILYGFCRYPNNSDIKILIDTEMYTQTDIYIEEFKYIQNRLNHLNKCVG